MREHASSRYIQSSDAFPFSGIKLIFHVLTQNVVICAGSVRGAGVGSIYHCLTFLIAGPS